MLGRILIWWLLAQAAAPWWCYVLLVIDIIDFAIGVFGSDSK